MSDNCIVEGCTNSGGLYVTCGHRKTGPYCSQHRFELQTFINNKKNWVVENNFNKWVDEWLKSKEE